MKKNDANAQSSVAHPTGWASGDSAELKGNQMNNVTIESFLPSSPEGSTIESGIFGGDHRVKGRALRLIEKMRDHNEALRTADIHLHYNGDYGAVITVVGVPWNFKGYKGLDRKITPMNNRYEKTDRSLTSLMHARIFGTGQAIAENEPNSLGYCTYEVAYC